MDLFAVIADPTRRQMIDMMRAGEQPAGAFVAAFPSVSQPAVSQHLRVLRDSGIARVRAEKQRRFYALRAEALLPLESWLAPHRAGMAADTTPAVRARTPKARAAPVPETTLDLFG